jgi:SAM-dependent methyltransferase
MTDHLFKCLHCGGTPLDRGEDAYHCRQCRAAFAIKFGVPLFLRHVQIAPSACQISRETASQICRINSLPEDEAKLQTLQQILAHNYQLPDLSLAAENNYFLNRIPLPEHLKRPPLIAECGRLPVNEAVRYQIVGHMLPDVLPCGTTLTRNVRLRNTGASIISSKTPNPVKVSYHWRTPAGALVEKDGERTALPIDLLPGRTMTLPTLLRTPAQGSAYMLELTMVHEGVDWLDGDSCSVGVDVAAGYRLTGPAHWVEVKHPTEDYTYEKDHDQGRKMLAEEVRRRHRPGMRVLEVGGCCNPMARGLDAEVYSVDIDVQTLQVGQLSVTDPAERLQFLCADAHDLPFTDHSFDCVVMFSSLHHFADPCGVLCRLKRLLKKDGFLAVMCEPVGCYLNGQVSAEFVGELEQGINEQIFTREEYHHMFQRAGLYTSWASIEGGSFKAFLQAVPGPAAGTAAAPLARRGFNWSRIWGGIRRRLRRSA